MAAGNTGFIACASCFAGCDYTQSGLLWMVVGTLFA